MNKFDKAVLVFCMFLFTGLAPVLGSVKPLPEAAGSSNKVFYLPQFSEFEEISDGEMRFFRKTLRRAEKERAKALILEMDTPGGSVETAFKYLSIMEKSTVPIVVYLNPNGISAGMIIAMGADRAAISPNGLIGDAMPIAMGINGVKPVTDKPVDNKSPKPAEPEKKKAPEKSRKKSQSSNLPKSCLKRSASCGRTPPAAKIKLLPIRSF